MGTLLGCIERKQGFRAPQLLLVVCNRNPYNFSSERKTLLLKKEKKKMERHCIIGVSLSEGKKHSSSFGEMKRNFLSL